MATLPASSPWPFFSLATLELTVASSNLRHRHLPTKICSGITLEPRRKTLKYTIGVNLMYAFCKHHLVGNGWKYVQRYERFPKFSPAASLGAPKIFHQVGPKPPCMLNEIGSEVAWRIIPLCKWLITMVSKSPK